MMLNFFIHVYNLIGTDTFGTRACSCWRNCNAYSYSYAFFIFTPTTSVNEKGEGDVGYSPWI